MRPNSSNSYEADLEKLRVMMLDPEANFSNIQHAFFDFRDVNPGFMSDSTVLDTMPKNELQAFHSAVKALAALSKESLS